MEVFMNIMYVLIVMSVFLFPGFVLTTQVYRLATGGENAHKSVQIQGCIPIWNNFVIQKLLYGSSKLILKAYFLLVPIVILRVVALVIRSETLLMLTAILDIIGIVICWVIASYVAIDVGRMIEVSAIKLILCIVAPPLGCYVVARSIGPYLKHSDTEMEDTFLQDE